MFPNRLFRYAPTKTRGRQVPSILEDGATERCSRSVGSVITSGALSTKAHLNGFRKPREEALLFRLHQTDSGDAFATGVAIGTE